MVNNKILTGIIIGLAGIMNLCFAQSNEDCLMCHEDPELTTERQGRTISMYVNQNILMNSVHKDVDCVFCHEEAEVEEFPHNETLAPVNCGNCHDVAQMNFEKGIHGQALMLNDPNAPSCKECHGNHDILHLVL